MTIFKKVILCSVHGVYRLQIRPSSTYPPCLFCAENLFIMGRRKFLYAVYIVATLVVTIWMRGRKYPM